MKYDFPKKIIKALGTTNADNLLKEKILQIGLKEPDVTVIGENGFLILDFGEELSGCVRILTHSVKNEGKIRLRFGESVSETCSELGEKNSTNDHSLRDFYVNLKNYSDMSFGQTGFRFLRIDCINEISVKSVVAANDSDEREFEGAFESDDELLNDIWLTAAKTLRLCLKNGYIWDGVKRDRLVWIGDVYPETKTARCLFADVPEIKNSLIFSKEQTSEGGWMNDIPSYSLWWLYTLCEYYDMSADGAFIEENLSFIEQIVSNISDCVSVDGETDFPFNFIDWASHCDDNENDEDKRNDEFAGTNYLIRLVFNRIGDLIEKFGGNAERIKDVVCNLQKKQYAVKKYKQIAALGILVGENVEANLSIILNGGAKGLTTFLNYFIFSALANCGRHSDALNMIREYYGQMLKLGATTFWEDFDVEWAENSFGIDELPVEGKKDVHGDFGRFCYTGFRHSLCHGWASGVLAYITENVLGIKPVEGSNFKYVVSPNLGNLQRIKGKYPTPFGIIEIRSEKLADGTVKTVVTAPNNFAKTIIDDSKVIIYRSV